MAREKGRRKRRREENKALEIHHFFFFFSFSFLILSFRTSSSFSIPSGDHNGQAVEISSIIMEAVLYFLRVRVGLHSVGYPVMMRFESSY